MVEDNERVLVAGGCWRRGPEPPWQVAELDPERKRVTLARWSEPTLAVSGSSASAEPERVELVLPWSEVLDMENGWRECDPELMQAPLLRSGPDTGAQSDGPTRPWATADAWPIYDGVETPLNERPAEKLAPRAQRFPHSYPGAPHSTTDCAYGCGCWAGPSRSGGPEGVEPFGDCPRHPERRGG